MEYPVLGPIAHNLVCETSLSFWSEVYKFCHLGSLHRVWVSDTVRLNVLHIDRQTFLMYPKMPNRKQDTSCGHGDDATRCERSQPFSGTIRVPQSRLRHLDHDVHLVHIAVGTLKKKETYLKMLRTPVRDLKSCNCFVASEVLITHILPGNRWLRCRCHLRRELLIR